MANRTLTAPPDSGRKPKRPPPTFEAAKRPSGKRTPSRRGLSATDTLTLFRRDQELRFTVHDSPDYYQLKLSVFNDDKKTELIGEAWIDLRDIIVPGGGQSDDWQTLTCKGKYAGDIRIEITFYDARPKPDKPFAKPRPLEGDQPAGPKAPKRRPLPSDPYTGQVPAQPPPPPAPSQDYPPEVSTPEYVQPPARVPPSHVPLAANHRHSQADAGQYSTPPSLRTRHADSYSSGPGSAYHPPSADASLGSLERERFPVYADDTAFSPDHQGHTPDRRYTQASPYGTLSSDPGFGTEMDNERPPPPPAHRITPGGMPEAKQSPGRDVMLPNQTPPVMRKDVLRNEAHRQSGSSSNAYPGRPVYRGYDSAPGSVPSTNDPYALDSQQVSTLRHHSYDAAYESHHRSLQPTVEDVPDSEDYRRNGSRAPPYDEPVYRNDPSPAPLNLMSGRNSAPAVHYDAPHGQSVSPDYARTDLRSRASAPSYDSRSAYAPYPSSHELELSVPPARAADHTVRFEIPAVPTSLIPGVDPTLAMDIPQRAGEDRRHERRHTQPAPQHPPVGSMRGRQMIDAPPHYGAAPRETSQHFEPSQHYDNYERSAVLYNGGVPPPQPASLRGMSPGHSPSGHNTIKRKSVSPQPPPSEHRLSGVPFGPDSYDALNPTVAPKPKELVSPDYDEINGKIITHDGREVDPSDHLPMDTWAPEPEPKTGKKSSDGGSRPSLSGPQPPPPSGRKALRIRERPASSLPPATYISAESKQPHPLPPPGTGRNRLVKKAARNSAMPVMMSGANGSGGFSQPQDRDTFAPRSLGRASTFDYENNNPPPMYDVPAPRGPGTYNGRDHSSSAPPIPAKIPIAAGGGGAMVPMGYDRRGGGGGGGGAGGEMTLMEEMSRIDLGTGRARRHAHQRPAIGGY